MKKILVIIFIVILFIIVIVINKNTIIAKSNTGTIYFDINKYNLNDKILLEKIYKNIKKNSSNDNIYILSQKNISKSKAEVVLDKININNKENNSVTLHTLDKFVLILPIKYDEEIWEIENYTDKSTYTINDKYKIKVDNNMAECFILEVNSYGGMENLILENNLGIRISLNLIITLYNIQ